MSVDWYSGALSNSYNIHHHPKNKPQQNKIPHMSTRDGGPQSQCLLVDGVAPFGEAEHDVQFVLDGMKMSRLELNDPSRSGVVLDAKAEDGGAIDLFNGAIEDLANAISLLEDRSMLVATENLRFKINAKKCQDRVFCSYPPGNKDEKQCPRSTALHYRRTPCQSHIQRL